MKLVSKCVVGFFVAAVAISGFLCAAAGLVYGVLILNGSAPLAVMIATAFAGGAGVVLAIIANEV